MSATQWYGRSREAAERIVELFQEPAKLPDRMATIWLKRSAADRPSDKWSFCNQIIAAMLAENGDARGIHQWNDAGRTVKKGAKAFPILVPRFAKRMVEDRETGEQKMVETLIGFASAPVFGIQDTEGPPVEACDPDRARWFASLPFRSVAEAWNIKIDLVGVEKPNRAGGSYSPLGSTITLHAKNPLIWAHELMHAADHRVQGEIKGGQEAAQEIVAQLGASVLLTACGMEHAADLADTWRYVTHYAADLGRDVASVCMKLLDRTCKAVDLILSTAEQCAEKEPQNDRVEYFVEEESHEAYAAA